MGTVAGVTDQRSTDAPEFGPRGYLPGRAAARARKIVLRAPLGLQWVAGALLAGVVVVVAGVVFLVRAGDPPGPPFVAVGAAVEVGDLTTDADRDLVLVGAGGRIRAFAAPPDPALVYCPDSGHLESDVGVWAVTGRGLAGTPSLAQHPAVVIDGTLYVDPTTTAPGPPPSDDAVERGCPR